MATDLQEMAKQEAQALEGIVWVDPERMDGAPCFYGTRVPIRILFDYIEGGEPLEEFLGGFPSVTPSKLLLCSKLRNHLLKGSREFQSLCW